MLSQVRFQLSNLISKASSLGFSKQKEDFRALMRMQSGKVVEKCLTL